MVKWYCYGSLKGKTVKSAGYNCQGCHFHCHQLMSGFVVVQSLSCVQLFAIPWTAARPPCLSPSPGVCSNSCPLNQWCHPTISSSVAPFSSCPHSFPASRSFPVSWLFTSGGQSIGASVSAPALSMNTQGWFLLGLIALISLQPKGLSRAFSSTTVWRHQFFSSQPFLLSSSHIHTWLLEEKNSFHSADFCWQSDVSAF